MMIRSLTKKTGTANTAGASQDGDEAFSIKRGSKASTVRDNRPSSFQADSMNKAMAEDEVEEEPNSVQVSRPKTP